MDKWLLIILFVFIIIFFYKVFKRKKKNVYIEYNLYNGSKWGPKKTADTYRFGDIFS